MDCWGAVGGTGVSASGLLDDLPGTAVLPARVASPREAPQR